MSTHTHDLRADLHGRALEYARGVDRKFFEANPDVTTYTRDAVDHELCPAAFGQGRCVSNADLPPAPGGRRFRLVVDVVNLGRGVLIRQPRIDVTDAEGVQR